jgi:sortase A
MVAGLAILVYVAITYAQSRSAAVKAPSWNSTERAKGQRLATALAHHQKIAVPKGQVAANVVGREPATRIVIPKIAVDAPVVETPPTDGVWEVADWAVGHLSTTPQPGAPGNMALSAHDDIKGEIFKRLDELHPGDEIRLYTRHEIYSYIVTSQQVVDPSDIAVLAPTAAPTVTLISCTPYWVDTQRLVVQATLKMHAAV